MSKIKAIFEQTILIVFGIVAAMALEGMIYHFRGKEPVFQWYHLVSILVAAFLCSIPGLLFMGMENMTRRVILTRMILHGILVYAITMGTGAVFGWYDSVQGFVYVSAAYFLVYIFVWISIMWMNRKDANKINSALDSIRDEE